MAGEHFWRYFMQGMSETFPRTLAEYYEDKRRANRPLTRAEELAREQNERKLKQDEKLLRMKEYAEFGAPFEEIESGRELAYKQPPLLEQDKALPFMRNLATPIEKLNLSPLLHPPTTDKTEEEKRNLSAYKEWHERYKQSKERATSIYDPYTGELKTFPGNVKIAPSQQAKLDQLSLAQAKTLINEIMDRQKIGMEHSEDREILNYLTKKYARELGYKQTENTENPLGLTPLKK